MISRRVAPGLLFFLLVCVVRFAYSYDLGGEDLVLVSATNSPIKSLPREQARRLFLGASVSTDGHVLVAFRNISDPHLYQMFLQKVVFMSARRYERLLLSQTFRSGRQRPREYTDLDELTKVLNATPGSVSYVWSGYASEQPRLKVLTRITGEAKL